LIAEFEGPVSWAGTQAAETLGRQPLTIVLFGTFIDHVSPEHLEAEFQDAVRAGSQHRRRGHRDACLVILGGAAMGAAHPVEAPGHELKFIPSPSCRVPNYAAQ
jgi:hypothetical protein